ncbi:hypothetical protein GCM10027444_01790 [Actinopolyspora lacussalsi]
MGWFSADPAAAPVIAVMAAKEGREAWRGDGYRAQGGLATTFPSTPRTASARDATAATSSEIPSIRLPRRLVRRNLPTRVSNRGNRSTTAHYGRFLGFPPAERGTALFGSAPDSRLHFYRS